MEVGLRRARIGTAVPPGSVPSAAWRVCADLAADAVLVAARPLQGSRNELPDAWTSPSLIWLPKSGKAPTAPSLLRLIGLLRPDAKAVAGAIKSRLLPFALARLQDVPQYAYLPGRDILDCLARVHGRLEAARPP